MTHLQSSSELWARTRALLWLLTQGSFSIIFVPFRFGLGSANWCHLTVFVSKFLVQRRLLQVELGEVPTLGKSHTNDYSRREWPIPPVGLAGNPVRLRLRGCGCKASAFYEISVEPDPLRSERSPGLCFWLRQSPATRVGEKPPFPYLGDRTEWSGLNRL